MQIFIFPILLMLATSLLNCSHSSARLSKQEQKKMQDSLFVEKSYLSLKRKYPRIKKEDYLLVAKGKSPAFCLFQNQPSMECTDFGDFEYKYGRLNSAKDAYLAAVLFESYNGYKKNIKLYGALTQIAMEQKDLYTAQVYISKILFINDENKWAKEKLVEVLSTKQ